MNHNYLEEIKKDYTNQQYKMCFVGRFEGAWSLYTCMWSYLDVIYMDTGENIQNKF